MPDLNTQFTLAASDMKPVVNGITDQQLDAATPCAQFTVRDLLNHLFHVGIEMEKGARDEAMDLTATPGDYIETDWREHYSRVIDRLVAAWSAPGAVDGAPSAMGLPKPVMAQMSLFDMVVHPWDLAKATDQRYEPEPSTVAAAMEFLRDNGTMGRQMGAFDEPVAIDAAAPHLDQLIALSGRDPAWRP